MNLVRLLVVGVTSATHSQHAQVSYEYIACQQEKQGVLVLSEFAGAAQSLNGSIVVNPWDSQQVADAIHEAVVMPAEARAINHEKLFKVRIELVAWRTDSTVAT